MDNHKLVMTYIHKMPYMIKPEQAKIYTSTANSFFVAGWISIISGVVLNIKAKSVIKNFNKLGYMIQIPIRLMFLISPFVISSIMLSSKLDES